MQALAQKYCKVCITKVKGDEISCITSIPPPYPSPEY